jgi:N-acetyltransferase
MAFPENIVLENERVLLRPLRTDDLENLLPFALNEPDTWQFSLVSAAGEDGMREYIATAVKGKETQKEFPFIVFDKQANAYAGSTRFYDIDLLNENTQLGYTWYGEAFRRTGLNRHCKLLLLRYAFETWGMNRVEFRAAHSNHKSIAAMKAIGCVEEGILRSHLNWFQGGKRSSMVLSILKEEWENGVKENLIAKTK